jgi:hypothetical protein
MTMDCFRHLKLAVACGLILSFFGCDFFYDLDRIALTDASLDVSQPDVSPGDTVSDTGIQEPSDTSDVVHLDTSQPDTLQPQDDVIVSPDDTVDEPDVITIEPTDTTDGGGEEDVVEIPDVWEEPLCPRDFGIHNAACHLVHQSGCPQGQYCDLRFLGVPPPRPVCLPLSEAGPRPEGASCDGNVAGQGCQVGTFCVNWPRPDPRGQACSRFCLMSTGEGCGRDAFCTFHFADFDDVGLCVPRCDPYALDGCPQGQVCMADINYSQKTCYPEFRCMLHRVEEGPYMKSCVPNGVHSGGGCPRGQTCYPTQEGYRCVLPCQSDTHCLAPADQQGCEGLNCEADQYCDQGRCLDRPAPHVCGDPRGDYQLRYCDSIPD